MGLRLARMQLRGACWFPGIGRSIEYVQQIDELQRPLAMEDGGVLLMDLLWSDPTTNDAVEGVQPSPRGPGLVTFGPDRVKEFCQVYRNDNHAFSATWPKEAFAGKARKRLHCWLT